MFICKDTSKKIKFIKINGDINPVQEEIDQAVATYIDQYGLETAPRDLTAPNSVTYNPKFTSYSNGIGCVMIDYISLTVGNKELERITGEWIMLNNELTHQGNSKKMFYNSVYFNENYTLAEDNVNNKFNYSYTIFLYKR